MIIYSEKQNIGYIGSAVSEQQDIIDSSTVVKRSNTTLSSANRQFLKQLGFTLKRNVKSKK